MKYLQTVWAVESGKFLEKPQVRKGQLGTSCLVQNYAVVHEDDTRKLYDLHEVFDSLDKALSYQVFLLMEKKVVASSFLRDIDVELKAIAV